MTLDYSLTINVIKWMAIMCRLTAFFFAMPMFTTSHIPMRYKIAFLSVVSFVLLPLAPTEWFGTMTIKHLDLVTLSIFMLSEAALGLVIALVFMTAMEVFSFGGYLIDQELGYSMASLMDPGTEVETSVFSSFMMQLFIIIFLIFDGHLEVVRIAASSLQTLPPGTYLINDSMVGGVMGLTARIFVVGLQLALPVMAVNMLLNISLGIIARIGEEFPVLMLSFAIRFALGFLVLSAMVPTTLAICRNINEQMLGWLTSLARL